MTDHNDNKEPTADTALDILDTVSVFTPEQLERLQRIIDTAPPYFGDTGIDPQTYTKPMFGGFAEGLLGEQDGLPETVIVNPHDPDFDGTIGSGVLTDAISRSARGAFPKDNDDVNIEEFENRAKLANGLVNNGPTPSRLAMRSGRADLEQ